MKELIIDAKDEALAEVLAFVDEELEANDCSMKAQLQIDIAVEELFVNIAHYAYETEVGEASFQEPEILHEDAKMIEITFIDSGVAYNPLEKKDHDITLSAEERQIGGLGIYMVKKSMDDVVYAHKDGQNILTIRKRCKTGLNSQFFQWLKIL